MHENKKMQMEVSLLLSFFLAVSFLLIYIAAVVKTGFLPGNAWKNYLMGSGYGSKMSQEAQEKLTELLEEYGLPDEVAGELIRKETLYAEYSRFLEDCWKNETQILQRREEFEEQLKAQVMDYLASHQVKMTEQLEREIQNMAVEAGGIYESCLNPGWLVSMGDFGEKCQGALTAAAVSGICMAAACILLLWHLHHYKHRAVRFMCFAMEASLAWSLLSLVFLGQKGWLAQSGIEPLVYQELIGGLTDIGIRNGLLALGAELWLLLLLLIWMKRLKHDAQ